MIRKFIPFTLLFLCLTGSVNAADFNLESSSYFRILRDRYLMQDNKTYLPFYEYLSANVSNLGTPELSFHISGWGRGDITSRGDGSDRGDGELIYGYVRWQRPDNKLYLNAGRQFISSGPAAIRSRYMDGLYIRSDLAEIIGIEALGGSPVLSAVSGRSGDYITQGRIYLKLGKAEVGASYARAEDDSQPDQENIGFDIWLKPSEVIEANGYAYFDLIAENFADTGLNVNYSPLTKPWQFALKYNYITPADFISRNSIFFVFSDVAFNDLGLNAAYFLSRYITVDGNLDWYHYTNDTDASKFGLDVNYRYGYRGRHTASVGLHRLDEFESGITELRGYNRFWFSKKWSISADCYFYLYDKSIRGRGFSFTTVESMNYEAFKNLTLTGSAYISTNPYFDADVRGLFKLTYNFGGFKSVF